MSRDGHALSWDLAEAFGHNDLPWYDCPTLAELLRDERSPDSFRPDYGPNDHTCQVPRLRGLTCVPCVRGAS
jgi:hypothetical protein